MSRRLVREKSGPRFVAAMLLWFGVLLVGAGGCAAQSASAGDAAERLVPAAMGIRTDSQGNTWNIEQNGTLGRVGTSMVNSGLNLLINDNQFYTYQPLMTADGSEYVLHNRQSSGLAGLLVARRIRVMEAEGVVRYLEVLSNTTSNAISLNVTLRTQFSGNYKAYYTDQGNSSVVTLGPRESGVLVTPGSTQANRAVVFSLCSPKSELKPSISSQNRYGLSFQYHVQLAPGQTICLAHAVTQVPVPQAFDRKSLRQAFRGVEVDRLGATIPMELRPLTRNWQRSSALAGHEVLSIAGVSALGVERGRRDVLALGEETRLIGAASCGDLNLTGAFGAAALDFAEVTAIEGGNRNRRDSARVFLKDGQVFRGDVAAADLRFVLASGGDMEIDLARLDRLVRAQAEGEGKWSQSTVALLETFAGDRLAISRQGQGTEPAGGGPVFTGLTPWGALKFSLEDILWLAPREDEAVGHYVEFRDGTRCLVFLAGDSVTLRSALFGDFQMPIAQIRALLSDAGHQRNLLQQESADQVNGLHAHSATALPSVDVQSPDAAPPQPYVSIVGNQRLVGGVQNARLHVLTRAEPIAVAPGDIRSMTKLSDEVADAVGAGPGTRGHFRLQLWGGGVVSGPLAEDFLDISVRGDLWKVPVADLVELATPVPQLSEAAQQSITTYLRQLGAEDWQQRETATEELIAVGQRARSLFENELRISRDPEVRRRLERILARIE